MFVTLQLLKYEPQLVYRSGFWGFLLATKFFIYAI